jgi:hypothetical protein
VYKCSRPIERSVVRTVVPTPIGSGDVSSSRSTSFVPGRSVASVLHEGEDLLRRAGYDDRHPPGEHGSCEQADHGGDRPQSPHSCGEHTLARVSITAAIVLGALIGLALGIVVSVSTDVPLAPEVGLVLGGLLGWLWRRDRA